MPDNPSSIDQTCQVELDLIPFRLLFLGFEPLRMIRVSYPSGFSFAVGNCESPGLRVKFFPWALFPSLFPDQESYLELR